MDIDTPQSAEGAGSSQRRPEVDEAPRYLVPQRDVGAVEVPAVVENIDRAVKAFGRLPSLEHTLDPLQNSISLYLRPESVSCKPIVSHCTKTHNVVLKVTVPKRTGRKRKKGSDDPWQVDAEAQDSHQAPPDLVHSYARRDDPKILQRKLQDNVDNYSIEAVGVAKHTHRFRGAADFSWDLSRSEFAKRYTGQVLPGDVEQLRQFTFTPGRDSGPNVDVIPPPIFTHNSLPFNYFYSQNPYVKQTENGTINSTAPQSVGHFISAEAPTPTGPRVQPNMEDVRMVEAIAQLEHAFEERPVWTRRALLNHLGGKLRNWNELKKYINYVAYQFKGGPWRDGVVPYGLDPRTDPKYRIYQTVMFKMPTPASGSQDNSRHSIRKDETWHSIRKRQLGQQKEYDEESSESHLFDGYTYHTDGKVWQMCDITDPLLKDLIDNADIRPQCDLGSGWFHGGLWAKIKAIMKTKLVAIQFGRVLSRSDFEGALNAGNLSPAREGPTINNMKIPLPNLRLTDSELTILRGYEPPRKRRSQAHLPRSKNPAAATASTAESRADSSAAAAEDIPTVDNSAEQGGSDGEAWNTGSEEDDDIDGQLTHYPVESLGEFDNDQTMG